SHHHFACEAARRGAKYILCEKPMASSVAQCDEIIDLCRQNGVKLSVNYHLRFSELHQQFKSVLCSKDLCGMTSVHMVTASVGMAMIGTHMFDLFSFMTGEKVREVAAWLCPDTSTNPRGEQFKDSGGTVVLATENGKRFYLNAGTQQGHGITVVYGAKYGQLV